MKQLERLFFVSIAALGLAACSSEMDVAGDAIGDVKRVSMNVADFEWAEGEQTRTTAVNNGGSISFRWSAKDTVGIFPDKGDQVSFPIEEGAGTGTAVFNGGGWALKSQSTYVAYYPYSFANRTGEAIPMTYEGQTQVGNDNLDNLTKCDYIVSSISTPSNGEASFQFKHMGALARFVLTVPEAATLTEFTLSSEDEVFPVGQTMNVRTNPVAITNKKMSKTISMSISGISASAGSTVTLYILLPAANLDAKSLTATLASATSEYTATITGKNYESGRAYSHSATLEKAINHEYVDLGLPSGTLWATCNIGAENSWEYGDYFAWGETTGHNSDMTSFSWENYKHCNGSYNTMKKYCTSSSYGTVDNKTELDPEDDAAYVNWGSEWRMPSHAQLLELVNSSYTTITWTTLNGVYGWKIAKISDSNVYIFLPAAGYRDASLSDAGSYGYYWSRSLSPSYSNIGWLLYFCSSDFSAAYRSARYLGRSVRPVRSASE